MPTEFEFDPDMDECDDDDGGSVCPNCGDDALDTEEDNFEGNKCHLCRSYPEIAPYEYKPSLDFYKTTKDAGQSLLYFGLELELEKMAYSYQSNTEISHALQASRAIEKHNGRGRCCYKYDGSLSYGVEIVSMPMTLRYWETEFQGKLSEMLSLFRSRGFRPRTTCGQHIHISKKSLKTMPLYRFLSFIYNPINRHYIVALSDRADSRTLDNTASLSINADISLRSKARRKDGNNRYTAVNLRPADTMEVRIFASSLDPEIIIGRIEFCHALLRYSGLCKIAEMREKQFRAWAKTQAEMYPNLQRLI